MLDWHTLIVRGSDFGSYREEVIVRMVQVTDDGLYEKVNLVERDEHLSDQGEDQVHRACWREEDLEEVMQQVGSFVHEDQVLATKYVS